MSRDITPTQSRVPVFVLTRLCANAEIGVPREELPLPVIPAKAGILIRVWMPCVAHRSVPHQRLQDIQTQNNPYFKRLSRVVDGNSMTLINNISR